MVLHPLEFSECYLDSPWFRENIQQYEQELEKTSSQIKQLMKDGKTMLNACRTQGKMMMQFHERLQNFQFDFGENLTDDEKGIAGSLKEFGLMLEEVSTEWLRTIERSELQLIQPLELFRKDHIHSYRESKKSFEKASERYYKQLEHTLGLSHKKKEQQLQVFARNEQAKVSNNLTHADEVEVSLENHGPPEAKFRDSDNDLFILKKNFHREALQYVDKLQEVQERKKFEFVEHLLMFMQVYFNYFHQTHETAFDCKDYMKDLQVRLVATREQFVGTRDKTQTLMKRMLDQPDSEEHSVLSNSWSKAGYLFLMDKNSISARLTSKWTKYFCMYTKESKLFQMVSPYHSSSNAALGSKVNLPNSNSASSGFSEPVIVNSCTRRITDSIDKRFCFDLEVEDTSGKQSTITFQAVSDADRKRWMSVMDGKEPQYVQAKDFKMKENVYVLNDAGFDCVKKLINEIERRGVYHEGIYRLVGVMSKVDMILRQALNPATAASVNFSDEDEWETNTLTSALKSYFRNLPEPLMTFDLHSSFIDAAKCDLHDDRVKRVSALVSKLPENNKKMLALLAEHLEKVQEYHETNKMTSQNLGVCFGPTLMRQRQETVQAIMEIKFSNIIVEILVEERNIIFGENLSLESAKGAPPKRPVSPRIPTKNISNGARLPSNRLKQRPRGVVYEMASMPNLMEEELAMNIGDVPTRNSRSMAFNKRHRSPSPRREEKRTSQISTSSDEGGFGHISPIDLNLNLDHLTSSLDKNRPVFSKFPPASTQERVSKEEWPLNGGVKPTKEKIKPMIPPKNPELRRAVSPMLGRKTRGDITTAPKSDSKNTSSAPLAPKRLPAANEGSTFTTREKRTNTNNSNNSNDDDVIPNYADKLANHKTSAKSESIRERTNKIFIPKKESLPSPTVPAKFARKQPFESNTNRKVPLRRESSVTKPQTSKEQAGRRPKSEFIPAAFRELQKNSASDANQVAADNSNHNTTSAKKHVVESHFKPTIPRSSPLVVARTPDNDTPKSFPENIDFEITSSIARTLYACEAGQGVELSFQPGQMIRNIRKSDEPGWLYGVINGESGLIPRNYIMFM